MVCYLKRGSNISDRHAISIHRDWRLNFKNFFFLDFFVFRFVSTYGALVYGVFLEYSKKSTDRGESVAINNQ